MTTNYKRPAVKEDGGKLKRMRVWDKIKIPDDIDFDLEGPVFEVIERLRELHLRASINGWKEIRLVHESNYDEGWYELHGTRMETDKEMRRRFEFVRKRRAKAPKRKK